MAETLSAASESDDDSDQSVSIHKAAKHCNVSQLRRALAAGVSPNSTNHVGQPLIISLCYLLPANYIQEARLACLDLLRQSPDFDVNAPDRNGDLAIHYLGCHATSRNDVEFMQAVVDAGADVNAAGGRLSRTALHWATSGSAPFVAAKIDLLIRAGASVTARDDHGKTPLDLAISQGGSARLLDLSDDYIQIRRIYPVLLAAGAALATSTFTYGDAYLQRVITAGGWANYERHHLDRLTAMLTPKPVPADGPRRSRRRLSPLRHVPPEVLRRIAAFAFHVGYY